MPDKRSVRINQGRLIPLWIRLLLTAGLFGAMLYANLNLGEQWAIFLSILFAVPVFPIWNTFYLLEIDSQAKIYLNGYWTTGITWGKWKSYNEIVEIEIMGPEIRKPKNPRSGSKAYHAYLSLDNGTRIYLLGKESKTKLNEVMKDIYNKLQLGGVINKEKH